MSRGLIYTDRRFGVIPRSDPRHPNHRRIDEPTAVQRLAETLEKALYTEARQTPQDAPKQPGDPGDG